MGERTELSDGTGSYLFTGVPNGIHRVRLIPEPGSEQSLPEHRLTTHTFLPLPTIVTPQADLQTTVDHVFDPTRGLHYISTNDGKILRLDVRTREFLAPFDVGIQLGGIDITPDGSAIYVAEQEPGTTQSIIRKVDPESGAVTNLTFDRVGLEAGAYDLAIMNNGKAIFTTNYRGTGFTPVREINLVSDTISIRGDALGAGPGGTVPGGTRIGLNGGRAKAFFRLDNLIDPLFEYRSTANGFFPPQSPVRDNAQSGVAFDPLRPDLDYTLTSTQVNPIANNTFNRIYQRVHPDTVLAFDDAADISQTFGNSGQRTQGFFVPFNITAATVSWFDDLNSLDTAVDANKQNFRVRLLNQFGIPVREIFNANVVDAAPNYRSFDLTSALQSLGEQFIFLAIRVDALNADYNVKLENVLLHASINNTTGFLQPVFETLANGNFYQTAMSPDGDELFLSTTTGLHVYTPTPTNWRVLVNDNNSTDFGFGARPVTNLAPQAADDFYTTAGSQSVIVTAANGILKNDREANLNQSLSIQIVTTVQHGTLTLNPSGSFTYTGNPLSGPNPFVDTDNFSYQLFDGITTSSVVTVLITKNANTGSSLSGLEFNDFDGDGIFEPGQGETVAAGVKVFLDLNDNGIREPANEPQQLSAADGTWAFTGLTARDYRVRQIFPNGTRATWPIASSGSTLIVQPGVTDIVFDTSRQILYIAAGNDTIRRYSLVARGFLSPIIVGGAAIGLDLTPSNSTLYVADSLEVADKAFIRRVNLADGSVLPPLQFDTPGTETGCFDISIGANGKALITTTSSNASPVPLRELDLATGVITVRADAPAAAGGGLVGSGTRIFRGSDRSQLLLTEGTDATGPLFTYLSATGLFVDGPSTASVTNTRHSAVSRDSQLFASDIFGPSLMDSDFQVQEIFRRFDGGLSFDGTRDVLYAIDSFTDELVAYNVQNYQEIYRENIGENVGGLYYGQIGVIPDGQNLFLTTVSGVRAFDIGTSQGYLVTLANNTSVDGLIFGNITLPLSIHVAIPGGVMAENQGLNALTGTVSRTGGDLTIPLVVTLTSSDTTEASMAASVTILAGQTSATFPINAVDDNLLDGTQQVSITASAAPYGSVSDSIVVTDHELISVSLASHSLPEVGGQTVATISRSNTDNSLAMLITLTSSDTTEATLQPSVTIPAGQASMTVTLNAVDDLLFDGTRQTVITGSAVAYFSLSDIVNIVSDADPYRNLLINTNASPDNGRLYEYSLSGTRVNDTSIQPVAGGDYPIRDLVLDSSGKIQIFNGTFNPYLTTIDEVAGTRADHTVTGWSTANVGSFGGIVSFGQYIFVSDMDTVGDPEKGIIRFDTTDYSSLRFATTLGFNKLTLGFDGLLYGLETNQLRVYNPATLALVRTLTVPILAQPMTIAVNAAGDIFAVARDQNIYRYDSNFVLNKTVITTGSILNEIELSAEGQLVVSGQTGDVLVLDEALMDTPVKFSVSSTQAFVAFRTLRSATGLSLLIAPTTFVESAGANAARGMVSRPSEGSIAAALTVNLSSSDTTEASVPATVIIPAGKVSVTFAIAAVDDAVGDGPQNVTITAAASGQASGNTILTVTDDEFNYFTLSFVPTSMSEFGGTLTGTVTRTVLDNSGPVTVNLTSDDTTEATVPLTVLIPANQNTANFTVTAVDDALRDGTQTANITASAAAIASGSGPVSVTDNEVDTISINIVAGSISENGGSSSGTVFRIFLNNSSALIVTLTSDDTTEASVPGTVTILAGQNSVNFTVSGVNDALRVGSQIVNITAAAPGVASVSDGLDVTDDEVDFLSLSFLPTSMSENGGTLVGTVTRNALSNLLPVVVTLNSADTSEATVPPTVTILANQNSATFNVTAVNDALRDGTQIATIGATAGGFASGSGPVSVTDDEVDTISLAIVPGSISENGGTATGTVTRTFLNNSAALVVNLSSSDTGEASVPLSVTILANQISRTFTVTGVNDAVRDGTQTAVITASAAGVASSNANVSVTDDELDTIALSLSTDLMSESGGSITGTVTRIDLDNLADLVVSLSSSNTGEATVPSTVTILANQNSRTFTITAVDEAVADRAQTVTITASAAGHASVNKNLIVSDNETPFQNPRHPLDVTGDGFIVAGDVLAVINIINEIGTGAVGIIMPQYSGPPIFPDTSGDNVISALDALLVINYLNNPPPPGGEGEFDAFAASAPAVSVSAGSVSSGQIPAADTSAAALQALFADDSFWRQAKSRTPIASEGDSDWNHVVAAVAREIARRRGE